MRWWNFGHPEELSHLRHLRWLDCGRESAAIVRFLPRPDRLERLECIASDAGLVEIHRCRNLQELLLHEAERGKPFSARGMARLEVLGNLRTLDLGLVKVEGPAMEHLKGLTQLQSLFLMGSNVTDAGLQNLKGLTRLQLLYLTDTHVSDAGLQHLKGLTQLRDLDVEGTSVTDAGVEDLQKALPNLKMSR